MLKKDFDAAVKLYKKKMGKASYDSLVAEDKKMSKYRRKLFLFAKEKYSDIILAYGKVTGLISKNIVNGVVFSKSGFYYYDHPTRKRFFADYFDITSVVKGKGMFVVEYAGKKHTISIDKPEETATLLECILEVVNCTNSPAKSEVIKEPTKETPKKTTKKTTKAVSKETPSTKVEDENERIERLKAELKAKTEELAAIEKECQEYEERIAEKEKAAEATKSEVVKETTEPVPVKSEPKKVVEKPVEPAPKKVVEKPAVKPVEPVKVTTTNSRPEIGSNKFGIFDKNYYASDLKPYDLFLFNSEVKMVISSQFIPGRVGMERYRVRYMDINTHEVKESVLLGNERTPKTHSESRRLEYLYFDGDNYYFMDNDTFEQYDLSSTVVGDATQFLIEGSEVRVMYFMEAPFLVVPPNLVSLHVVSVSEKTDDAILRDAELETGAKIRVPYFIKAGEKITVDTRTGEFLEIAKD